MEREVNLDVSGDLATNLLIAILMFAYAACWYFAAINFRSLPDFIHQHPLIFCMRCSGSCLLPFGRWVHAMELIPVLTGCAFTMSFLMWQFECFLQTAQRGGMAGTSALDHILTSGPSGAVPIALR